MHRLHIVILMPLGLVVAQVPKHRVSVSLSGGYAWFSPADLNSYINTAFPEIKCDIDARGEISYYVRPRLCIVLGAGYLRGTSEGNLSVTSNTGPVVLATAKESYTVAEVPIDLGIRHQFLSKGDCGILAGAFVELNAASATYHLDGTAFSTMRKIILMK